jgi:SAM-dependent methyltransferase
MQGDDDQMTPPDTAAGLPQEDRPVEHAQGHWLLARLGKRVLRPGGAGLTRTLLDSAGITGSEVVEFAPGLGWTARRIIEREPASYLGVDQDAAAAATVRTSVRGRGRVQVADVSATGLASQSTDLIVGEAMLTMQSDAKKREIVGEAARLLRPGGRYVVHELALTPEDIGSAVRTQLRQALARAVQVNARPMTVSEWREMIADQGLVIERVVTAPMALLEPTRIVSDEGLWPAIRFATRVVRRRDTRRRVLLMRRTFHRNRDNLVAVGIVARKPGTPPAGLGSHTRAAATLSDVKGE